MIYFLDNSLQLQKIVTSKNVISAIHEHELNGLIRGDIELDLSYANKFLVLGIDHVGYYYKDEFYLHKIQRVEYDHVNESAKVVLRHIFFEDMIFGKLIRDVRPQNQDALTVSRQTIDTNTRWQTIMTDVTGRLSTNFYWQVPYEVIEFMTENYRIEYLPKILFDGKKINGFQLHLANKIGEDKNIRIPYGSRVLDLKYEEDYSEIITKLVVHGKGEEVGDGYGRRINISDVNFSRNGVKSPVGSLYLEDETITSTYGNDGQTPREGREVFEDIEDANELAEAGYQHYLQVSRPQMLFTADVADIGDVGIGDSVMIIRREYDVYFNARIHKLSVDLLYPEDAQVELGDYKHFKESKIARKTREKNNRVQGQLSDRITRLKKEANERFDNEVAQWKAEYDQALIDAQAEVEAAEVRMTEKIEGQRTEMTNEFNQSVAESKEYAEQQAQAKADSVQSNLDSFSERHQQLYDEVTGNVLDIDTFLGDKSVTLKQQFDSLEQGINQSIGIEQGRINALVTDVDEHERNISQLVIDVDGFNQTVSRMEDDVIQGFANVDMRFDSITNTVANIKLNTRNMLRGTSFDNPELITLYGDARFTTIHDPIAIRVGPSPDTNTSSFKLSGTVKLEADTDYYLVIEVRTSIVPELDYLQLELEDGSYQTIYDADTGLEGFRDLGVGSSDWSLKTIRINSETELEGQLRIGTRFNSGDTSRGWIDIRQPYLTNTLNREWVPHPRDGQSVDELVERVSEIEQTAEEIRSTVYDSAGLATIIAQSSSAVDIIAKNINVTGNLNLRGQIEAISLSAVTADVAEIFSKNATLDIIQNRHLSTNSVRADNIFVDNLLVDKLVSYSGFFNELTAISLDAVHADLTSVNSKIMETSIIKAEWIRGGNALLDKVFGTTAMFERMMAKSGFVTTLNTVTIDTDLLTVRRKDGVAWIQDGMARGHVPVQIYDSYASNEVSFTGLNFVTGTSHWQTFKYFYTPHEGSRLRISWAVGLQDGPSNVEYIEVRVRNFSDYSPINMGSGESVRRATITKGDTTYITQDIPMPPPNYNIHAAYLEFRRAPDGQSINNKVYARILHIGQYE